MTFRTAALFCFAAAVWCGAAAGQTLQLADGKVLLATIVGSPDGEGLRVKRLDNGGELELRWGHLSPDCAQRIKEQWSLASTDDEELMVRAHEVRFLLNGSPTTIFGRVIEYRPQIKVQRMGEVWTIPTVDLKDLRQIEVPVSQVYTKDEFYSARLGELQPGNEADKHIVLANDLIRVRDYEHAADHLAKAKELGNTRDPERLAKMAAKLEKYKAARAEREALDKVIVRRARGTANDFAEGQLLIAQWEKDFPNSPLKGEFEAEKKRFADARKRFLTVQVAENWRRQIRYVADKKCAVEDFPLSAAKSYAETAMTDEIAVAVGKQLKLKDDEVKALWAERKNYPKGRSTEHFAYGIGSWVLGEANILKGTRQGKEAAKDKEKKDAQQERDIERLTRLIRQGMERRAQQARGGGQGAEETDEDWWKQAARDEKVSWLRAYYAEYGGQLTVATAFTSPCISCFGEGQVSELGGDGKMARNKCYLCRGTKLMRSFSAW